MSGLKRKLKPEDGDGPGKEAKVAAMLAEPHPTYFLQRQAVLQLSLQKLCSRMETALVRRVLITNTLRYIQQELGQQGAPTAGQRQSGAAETSQGKGAGAEGRLEQDGELLFSLQSCVPAHPVSGPSPRDPFSTALAEIEDLCPTLFASSSTSPSSSATPQDHSRLGVPASEKEADILAGWTGPCDPAHSLGPFCLPDLSLDDVLFSDIDGFLCELNPCGPNPSQAQGSSPSPRAVTVVTEDPTRGLNSQPFRTDLNELDHIMEVLVGS